MKKTLELIEKLKSEGALVDYALGGATALLFYTEPALTFDVDVFIFLPKNEPHNILIDLGPLYLRLQQLGYKPEGEHINIEGIPVQFIPAYNALVEDALRHHVQQHYENMNVNVLSLEYLLAIMMDTGRGKDLQRIHSIVHTEVFDKDILRSILSKHKLLDKWKKEIGHL